MTESSELRSRLQRKATRVLGRLRRHELPSAVIVPEVPESHYYPQAPTCQVQDMWFILEFFLGRRERGCFIEVGAHDGYSFSNSWGLAERGWEGFLIEPVPQLAAAATERHRGHPRITVVTQAVGAEEGVLELQLAGALTTANAALAGEYEHVNGFREHLTGETVTVRQERLDSFLERTKLDGELDLVIVDVEGFEAAVFSGFDLDHWKPKILVVEIADVHPDLTTTRSHDAILSQSIQDAGYQIVQKDRINTIYVRQDCWARCYELHVGT